ncbi:MAG TPA: hypothetical protein VGV68_01890 [Terriglobia bacterium]|nr:hypothetical protein [Terriglobia bacterium]
MDQMEFVNLILAKAGEVGYRVNINRDGERRVVFDHKDLTADHLRRVFQDISRRKGLYCREDMEELVKGRPCAVAPFFELAVKAGLCNEVVDGRRKFYQFNFGSKPAVSAA